MYYQLTDQGSFLEITHPDRKAPHLKNHRSQTEMLSLGRRQRQRGPSDERPWYTGAHTFSGAEDKAGIEQRLQTWKHFKQVFIKTAPILALEALLWAESRFPSIMWL